MGAKGTGSPADPFLDDFLTHLRAERGVSPNTVLAYGGDLRSYLAWLREKGASVPAVQHKDISDFLFHRRDQGLKSASLYRLAESIKQFHRFLLREDRLPSDPTETMASPRVGERLPNVLSIDEMSRLLGHPGDGGPADVRFKAMLELMYASGLRVSELVGLKEEQVDLDEGFVRAFGKGGKSAWSP